MVCDTVCASPVGVETREVWTVSCDTVCASPVGVETRVVWSVTLCVLALLV